MHNLFFYAYALYMNFVTQTFLLVISSVTSKQLLCFLHGQGQKREQRQTTKNFVGFHNHFPLLAMLLVAKHSVRSLNLSSKPLLLYAAFSSWEYGILCVVSAAFKVNMILLDILLNNEWHYLSSYLWYLIYAY